MSRAVTNRPRNSQNVFLRLKLLSNSQNTNMQMLKVFSAVLLLCTAGAEAFQILPSVFRLRTSLRSSFLPPSLTSSKPAGTQLLHKASLCIRKPASVALLSATSAQKDGKTVLVVGGGLGGMSVSFDLRHKLRQQDRVVVVSDRPSFEFTPSNPWVATRFRKPEDIRVDLASTLPKHGVDFVPGKAMTCDPVTGILTTDGGTPIDFDYLVIATGARLDVDAVPGVREHSVSVCTTDHAIHAADKWDDFLEKKGPKSIVVGCLQGASCFGPGYEYIMMLEHELRKRKQRDDVTITMVTSEPYIGHLGLAGVGGSKEELPKLLDERNIAMIENARVDAVTGKEVLLTQFAGSKQSETRIPADFTAFIPAFKGQRIWESVPGLAAPSGMILVDEHMRSVAYDNVFAIGTAVSLPAVEMTQVPTGAPKTGYMIESMGTCAALNIRSQIDADEAGEDAHSAATNVPTLNALCITDFGKTGAAVMAIPQFQPRRMELHLVSPLVRLAKISFEMYFLHKVRTGDCDPYYEKWMLSLVGMKRMTDDSQTPEFLKREKSPLPPRTKIVQRDQA